MGHEKGLSGDDRPGPAATQRIALATAEAQLTELAAHAEPGFEPIETARPGELRELVQPSGHRQMAEDAGLGGGGQEQGSHQRAAVGDREGADGESPEARRPQQAAQLGCPRRTAHGARIPKACCAAHLAALVAGGTGRSGGKATGSNAGTKRSPPLLR